MPCPVITVQTTNTGQRQIPTKWAGRWLAVHRPVRRDGLSKTPGLWAVTLQPLGLSAGEIAAPLAAVLALAKLWDTPDARWDDVATAKDASTWQWRKRWLDEINRAVHGRPAIGPRELTPFEALDSAGSAAEVAAAVAAAMGAPTLTADEESEPFPVADALPADRVKMGQNWPGCLTPDGGWPMVRWRGQWWPAPTVGDVHSWCLDSVAETPDGREVEPDSPEAWPHILGLI